MWTLQACVCRNFRSCSVLISFSKRVSKFRPLGQSWRDWKSFFFFILPSRSAQMNGATTIRQLNSTVWPKFKISFKVPTWNRSPFHVSWWTWKEATNNSRKLFVSFVCVCLYLFFCRSSLSPVTRKQLSHAEEDCLSILTQLLVELQPSYRHHDEFLSETTHSGII